MSTLSTVLGHTITERLPMTSSEAVKASNIAQRYADKKYKVYGMTFTPEHHGTKHAITYSRIDHTGKEKLNTFTIDGPLKTTYVHNLIDRIAEYIIKPSEIVEENNG